METGLLATQMPPAMNRREGSPDGPRTRRDAMSAEVPRLLDKKIA